MSWPGAVMERRRRRTRRRKERRQKGRVGEKKKERERERLMSRQLHSRGHQSNTMQPAARRCLRDGQTSQLRF